MTTHYIACSEPTTFDDVQYSQHHTVCPRKSSFVTKGLIKKGEMEGYVKTTCETKIQTGE